MKISMILITSRRAVMEVEDFGIWNTEEAYEILVNGAFWRRSDKAVETIEGLAPDSRYQVTVRTDTGMEAKAEFRTARESVTLNVKRFHAAGDGVHDDTAAIQAAIMACPPEGRVYIPEGVYKVTSLFLKSSICIDIDEKAVLSGITERKDIPVLPGMIQSYDEESDYNLGTWEGNPLDCFASMITGIGVSDVVITGEEPWTAALPGTTGGKTTGPRSSPFGPG